LYISGTRVSGEGVALFVACHPNAVLVEHEESFHGLALAQKQNSASKVNHQRSFSINIIFKSPVESQVQICFKSEDTDDFSCPSQSGRLWICHWPLSNGWGSDHSKHWLEEQKPLQTNERSKSDKVYMPSY